MPGTRTARNALAAAAVALWSAGITVAAFWAADEAVMCMSRVLSVLLAGASTCTVCAVMLRNRDRDKDLLIRTLGDVTRRVANARKAPTIPMYRVK